MKKSKKTLKMLGICIIGILIVVVINMLKGPEDPFKNLQGGKVLYQHIEEKNLLNNPQCDSYFVYFYEVGNKKCEKANEDLKKEMTIISNVYYFNVEDTTLKTGKDFDYKNVIDYKDITIKQVPMLIHVENKKIDHVYYKASDIKKALE